MSVKRPEFVDQLYKRIQGDVYDDPVTLGVYATDASIYQIIPFAIVCPTDEADIRICLEIANEFKIPVLPRGGGTSLDRKSTRLNSSHLVISYAVFCLKKKN